MERWIRDRLLEKAKDISKIYEEIGENGVTKENQLNLKKLLYEEEMVYSLISIEDYAKYIAFFSPKYKELAEETGFFMTLDFDYIPEIRILHKLYFYQEKRSMFLDVYLPNAEEKRWQYVNDKEFYFQLMNLYSFYAYVDKENEDLLNKSFTNIVFHYAYAKEYYVKGMSSYSKDFVRKMGGISALEMEEEIAASIQSVYDFLIENGEYVLKSSSFRTLCYKMYLEAYYSTIENKNIIKEILNLYSKQNLPNLTLELRELFDEIESFIEAKDILKRKKVGYENR